jgi:broad-specificity NMP kinase
MRCTFIYGPPGVGKYTVGSALAAYTGRAFFHNHLTVDDARAIFPTETPAQSALKETMRVAGLEAAAREGVDVIFTFAYSGEVDWPQIAVYRQAVESHGGRIDFV